MKYFSKKFKIFALILALSAGTAIGISLTSYLIYKRVYFFDGYTITKVLWILVMIFAFVGSVGTLIFGVKDLIRLVKGQPLPTSQSTNGNVGAPQQVTVNESVSQTAQFEYKKRLDSYRDSGKEITELTEAALFAQAVELQTLKAPASAVFCCVEEMSVTNENDVYVVQGYVDSQNSYGAMIRTPFKCNVVKKDGVWKSADYFVSASANIATKVAANTAIYWIFGIVMSLILTGFFYFIFKFIF